MTDHKAEAENLVKIAADYSDPRNPLNAAAQLAQVYATLALVEQQRIANLLALIKPEDPRGYDTWPEISKALGLS